MALPFTSRVKTQRHLDLQNSAICSHESACACESDKNAIGVAPLFQNLGTRLSNLPTNKINDLPFLGQNYSFPISSIPSDNSISIENKLNRFKKG